MRPGDLVFSVIVFLGFMALDADVPASEWNLHQVDYELQPIIVTATRTPQTLMGSDANVAVITAMDIRQSCAQHLGEVLKMIPGITIGQYGGIGQNVSLGIRGSTAGQALILVDGVPVNDPQLGGLDLNTISLDNVDRIEVVRGGSSALYGADAMGGVINVITNMEISSKPFSVVSYWQGDHGLEKIAGRLTRRLGSHCGMTLMASKTAYEGYRKNDDFAAQHFSAKISREFGPWGEVFYSTQFYDADLGVPGMENMPTIQARQEDQSWNQAITMSTSLAKEQTLRGTIYRNSSRQEYSNPDWFVDATHRRQTYGIEVQHCFSPGSSHRMTWGGDVQGKWLDSSENGQHNLNRGAFFVQDEARLSRSLRARLTARYDHHQRFDDQISPDVTLAWVITERASLFASLRRSFRAPTFNDLYWPETKYDYDLDGKVDCQESGNSNIKPEKAIAFQMGFRGQRGFLMTDLCLFRRQVEDLIQWDNIDETYLSGYWMPVNTSRATIQGLEAHLDGSGALGLNASLAYTYLNAKDADTGYWLPYQPCHQLFGSVQYSAGFIPDQLELTIRVDLEYIGQRYADNWEGQSLSAKTLFHGKLTARCSQHLDVYFIGKNLQNKNYVLRAGYPLPGRTLSGGISWTFWN